MLAIAALVGRESGRKGIREGGREEGREGGRKTDPWASYPASLA